MHFSRNKLCWEMRMLPKTPSLPLTASPYSVRWLPSALYTVGDAAGAGPDRSHHFNQHFHFGELSPHKVPSLMKS